MKRIVGVTDNVGLESLLGKKVLLICSAYFYTGKLTGVNDTFVQLDKPEIVYETGTWSKSGYTDSQKLHTSRFFIQRNAIESFGKAK